MMMMTAKQCQPIRDADHGGIGLEPPAKPTEQDTLKVDSCTLVCSSVIVIVRIFFKIKMKVKGPTRRPISY